MFAASNFEFKYRFWIFGALFWIAFSVYSIDHQNSASALLDWFAHVRGTAVADWQYHAVFAVAALFCIANVALRTWATAYLNSAVMVDKRLHTTRLVADGPYRYVRNPLYLGNILLAIGFGLLASRLGFVILVVGVILFDYRLILREEAGILASQGDSYRAYCAAVPRLVPALRPQVASAGTMPRWGDGLLGEAFMWVLAAAVAVFAITLNQRIFYFVLCSAFVVFALCYLVIRKRQKATSGAAPSSTT